MNHTKLQHNTFEPQEQQRLLEAAAQRVETQLRLKRDALSTSAREYESTLRQKLQTERDADNAKPFLERQLWRKRWMYEGWGREEVLFAPTDRSAITRSHYGYEVLNTPDLGIVDVDFNLDYDINAQQWESLSQLRSWCGDHPEQSFRVYRTSKGLRYLRTDAPMPLDEDYDLLCAIVGADEVYRYMCRQEQNCFRARISPKPMRIQADWPIWNPYSGWSSVPTPEDVKDYEEAAKAFKTCTFLGTIGSAVVDAKLATLIELHDAKCRIDECGVRPEQLSLEELVVPMRYIDAVAFNQKYRPTGMAPQELWEALDCKVRERLRELDRPENVSAVMHEHDRCTAIESKCLGKAECTVAEFFQCARSVPVDVTVPHMVVARRGERNGNARVVAPR